MKLKFIAATLGVVSGPWLALAQAAEPNPQFLGTWGVDFSKSSPNPLAPPGPPPRSVTLTFKDIGGHRWWFQRITVTADGKTIPSPPMTWNTDGTPFPRSGGDDPAVDSATVTYPDAKTEIFTEFKGGKPVMKRTAKLSADGRQLTVAADLTDKDGKQYHYTTIMNKK
jgi:hypothetical protein